MNGDKVEESSPVYVCLLVCWEDQDELFLAGWGCHWRKEHLQWDRKLMMRMKGVRPTIKERIADELLLYCSSDYVSVSGCFFCLFLLFCIIRIGMSEVDWV